MTGRLSLPSHRGRVIIGGVLFAVLLATTGAPWWFAALMGLAVPPVAATMDVMVARWGKTISGVIALALSCSVLLLVFATRREPATAWSFESPLYRSLVLLVGLTFIFGLGYIARLWRLRRARPQA